MANIVNPIILMVEGGENKLAALLSDTLTTLEAEDFGTATALNNYAFYQRTALTNVDIPNTITSVGTYCFSGCTNLVQAIDLGTTLVSQDAFRDSGITRLRCGPQTAGSATGARICQGCQNLEVLEITEGATQAYTSLINNAPSIQYLILPSTITKIKSGSIVGSIPNLVLKSSNPPNTDSVSIQGTNLFVPLSSIDSYKASTYFSSFNIYPILANVGQAPSYDKALVAYNNDLTLWEKENGSWRNRGVINQF